MRVVSERLGHASATITLGVPDQWWVADSTDVWTHVGLVYVSSVTDVCSRRILGRRASTPETTRCW